jgi:hypothetical protein
MTGRPFEFTPEVAEEICDRIAKGESLRAICADSAGGFLPSARTFHRWLASDEEWSEGLRQQYACAREAQADHYADEIVSIADCADEFPGAGAAERDPQRDRLRIDARKWVASKLAPKKYGDKIDLSHSGKIALSHEDALAALS